MKPLIRKYFYVFSGNDSTSMSLKCSVDCCIDSGFLGDLGNVLRLIKEQKPHGEFGFEYELDFIIVCHYFFLSAWSLYTFFELLSCLLEI